MRETIRKVIFLRVNAKEVLQSFPADDRSVGTFQFVSVASNKIIIIFVTLYKHIFLFTVTVDFPPAEISIA